jgi:cytosine/adenosine deaminase-related metal-dependent hydrolase
VFAAAHPGLSPKKILPMATVNGARALGLAGGTGELSKGAGADLIAIPFAGKKADAFEAVVNFSGHVAASMIDGQWAIAPH